MWVWVDTQKVLGGVGGGLGVGLGWVWARCDWVWGMKIGLGFN